MLGNIFQSLNNRICYRNKYDRQHRAHRPHRREIRYINNSGIPAVIFKLCTQRLVRFIYSQNTIFFTAPFVKFAPQSQLKQKGRKKKTKQSKKQLYQIHQRPCKVSAQNVNVLFFVVRKPNKIEHIVKPITGCQRNKDSLALHQS